MPTQDEAKRALQQLIADYNSLSDEARSGTTEASVVRQFVDRLLGDVLGWPIKDPARYKYELYTETGRPDITLIPERGGTVYVEAKRFGVIEELAQAKQAKDLRRVVTPEQLTLPGMATDRTKEEQQAINYAFNNNGTWAILTNFERLRLFNARKDWLVISFEKPEAYLEGFEYLWQLNYENICDGSLDQLSNQRWTKEVDTDYLAFINREREILAQDVVAHREVNGWAFDDDGAIKLPLLRSVVQRYLDRLVIVRFAEDHFVIPPGTLRQFYELRKNNPYTQTMDQYLDHFFRRFDEDHNSALFSPGPVDEAVFSDAALLPLIDELYRARYRSMPADIIGNTYEQYLGKALALDNGSVTTRDNLETRKKQGSYYTPQVIVRYIVDHSLGRVLYGTADGQPTGEPVEGETRQTAADISDLRVLDSACGSGSFLIYAYEVLAKFYQSEIERLELEADARHQALVAQGMVNPLEIRIELTPYTAEIERISNYPRIILEQHLYGVDLDPQAAEIAVVNLMMRAMERRSTEKRLPLILNQNVKVGNSLIGLQPDDERMTPHQATLAELISLRGQLHTDPDKPEPGAWDALEQAKIREVTEPIEDPWLRHAAAAYTQGGRRALNMEDTHTTYHVVLTRTAALREQLNADFAEDFSDLDRVRPFHWGIEFPEAFYDADGAPLDNPGFTVIFGNPPWEIVKPDLREFYAQFDEHIESRLNRSQADKRIEELNAEDPRRVRDWKSQTRLIEESAQYYRATDDYTRQGRGDTATHKLFTERMYSLLRDTGRLGYVVPSGIYTDLGTKQLREMLLNEGHIQYIYSFSNERFFFPGVHHSFKFVLLGAQKAVESDGFWAAFRFNPRVAVAPEDLPEFLSDENNLVYVREESLEKFSPDSLALMEFQTQKDYQIAERIYAENPPLGEEVSNSWNVKFNAEFHVTNDRHLFNTLGNGLPLYEGKMIHQFDAFYAQPQYWLEENAAAERLAQKYNVAIGELDYLKSRMAYRGIARSTDQRTLMTTMLPPHTFSEGRSATTVIQKNVTSQEQLFLSSCMNSYVLDWILRQKVAANVNMFHIYQLPVPRLTEGDPYFDALVARAVRLVCVRDEFADLWREVMGTDWTPSQPLPDSLPIAMGRAGVGSVSSGGAGLPVTDSAARQQVRDEIDAIVAHLYGLGRDEFEHILRTFPLVFPADDTGETKLQALLAEYDRWAGVL